MRLTFLREISIVAVLGMSSLTAAAQIIYPAKGQSEQQQMKDEGECESWAKRSTGVDPVAVAQQPAPQGPTGPAVGGGERLRGAAAGAIVGNIAGDKGNEGAAVGVVAGGVRARRNQRAQQQQVQQQAQDAKNSQLNTYARAVAACMEGRGYTVK